MDDKVIDLLKKASILFYEIDKVNTDLFSINADIDLNQYLTMNLKSSFLEVSNSLSKTSKEYTLYNVENKIRRSDILTDEIKQSVIDMLYEEAPKELHYKIDDFKQTF